MGSFRSHQGMGVEKVEWVDITFGTIRSTMLRNQNVNENFMTQVKSFAKAVLRQRSAELWAFCSYLFWPQKTHRGSYDTLTSLSTSADDDTLSLR